jgi:hypothetical protein
MNDKQRRQFERGSRVESFISSNDADFPADGKGGRILAGLKTELANLAALDVTKATSMSRRQQGSAGRRDLRESLRAQVAAIADTAEIISRDYPELKGAFPHMRADRSDLTLIAVARSFVAAALPLKARFVEYDLPPDFIERLGTDADTLEQHMSTQTESTGTRVNTNASIEEALQHVDDAMERLDIIVRNKYRNDPAKVAAWESARHLERAARSKRGGETPPTPQTHGGTGETK